MEISQLNRLRVWFSTYCASFYSSRDEDQRNIRLKEEHTRNVCTNMALITKGEGLAGEFLATAEAIALFHDVGRFEQYRRYRTFLDSDSVNHAVLGAEVISESGILDCLPEIERRIILQSVRLHNVYAVPRQLDNSVRPFLNYIRDADKLDIWRVFIELFDLPPEERASAATLGLPDTGEYSRELLASLYQGEMIELKRLRTVNDFKLLQLSWTYDLNYASSLRLLKERDCIGRLAATLPDERDIREIIDYLHDQVDRKLAASRICAS